MDKKYYLELAKEWYKRQSSKNRTLAFHQLQEQFCKDYNLTHLTNGGSRFVIKLNETKILKLQLVKLDGFPDNQSEVERWLSLSEDEKINFATIHEFGPKFEYIIMEYIPYIACKYDDIPRNVKMLINDKHIPNYGQRADGTWVTLDYAS